MSLSLVFKLSLYALAMFAAWIIGRAEGGWIPFITFPILIAGFLGTETGRNLAIPAWFANTLGLLAVSAAGWEFSIPGPETKLLSGAHLLIYATWIVMLQEKTYRLYWWAMALGILQVAVASVLAPDAWYGFALVGYIVLSLWTMTVASMFQAERQYGGQEGWQLGKSLATGRSTALTDAPTAEVLTSVQHDESHQWLTRPFFGGLSVLITMSVFVSILFFTFTPRVWIGPRNIFGDETLAGTERKPGRTGFSKNVQLGEMGTILESVEPVFTIACYDNKTDEPIALDEVARRFGMEEPLFRGSVLTEYRNGSWTPERSEQPIPVSRTYLSGGIRQEIVLEPTQSEVLFCVGTPEACDVGTRSEHGFVHPTTGILVRERTSENAQRLTYRVYTPSSIPAEIAKIGATPIPRPLWWKSFDESYYARNQLLPKQGLERLQAYARQLRADREREVGRELTAYEVSKYFEAHLRDSGQFGYTLDLSIVDGSLDPVEDFLFNRKVGHCEYFASALALLLRSVKVPARVVTGFKGAERSELRGTYQVQDRFAHAWVESWTEHNMWVTLDPTPALERAASVEEVSSRLGFWGRVRSTTTNFWSDYVVNVNPRQQQDQVYAPMKEFVEKVWALSKHGVSWGPDLWAFLTRLATNPSEWLSVTGGIVAFMLLLLIAGLVRVAVWLYHWLRGGGWGRLGMAQRQQKLIVAFYERFLKAARRSGLKRLDHETPREFAETVTHKLEQRLTPESLEALPRQISEAFQRIRYGGESLSESDLALLDAGIARLEALLSEPPAKARA